MRIVPKIAVAFVALLAPFPALATYSGDTILIQFGHNDATRAEPERWAAAQTDYRSNLLRFIWDVRAAGGTSVLVTPVTRRSFGADSKAKADFVEYSAVMRELGARNVADLAAGAQSP